MLAPGEGLCRALDEVEYQINDIQRKIYNIGGEKFAAYLKVQELNEAFVEIDPGDLNNETVVRIYTLLDDIKALMHPHTEVQDLIQDIIVLFAQCIQPSETKPN